MSILIDSEFDLEDIVVELLGRDLMFYFGLILMWTRRYLAARVDSITCEVYYLRCTQKKEIVLFAQCNLLVIRNA